MPDTADLNPTIIDALYRESLALADEARIAFDSAYAATPPTDDAVRAALSVESLRTTTRTMHAIAWLLNQRAYFAGELSELQLDRHGRLPPPQPKPDPAQLAVLPAGLVELVERTQHFYERIQRLDRAWRERTRTQPSVHILQQQLQRSVGGL